VDATFLQRLILVFMALASGYRARSHFPIKLPAKQGVK
jgi:hypothetical protein